MAAAAVARPDAMRVRCLIVTRPQPEASHWAQALHEKGWPCMVLPLIVIGEPASAAAIERLRQHRLQVWQADAVMFVSAAAVRHFFASGAVVPAPPASRTRFWAPGPGTARALAEALRPLDVSEASIDTPAADAPQFDSEHLWPVVASQLAPGTRVLIVRGASAGADEAGCDAPLTGNGRDWLIQRCQAAGAVVRTCVAYERRAPSWSATERSSVLAASAPGHLWLFSSSEALAHLRQLLGDVDWHDAAALATHPRIAQAAHAAGFGAVIESRPALSDVLRSLESVTRHE